MVQQILFKLDEEVVRLFGGWDGRVLGTSANIERGWEKSDYVLVEAEGMDGGATAMELYLGVDGWILGRVMA